MSSRSSSARFTKLGVTPNDSNVSSPEGDGRVQVRRQREQNSEHYCVAHHGWDWSLFGTQSCARATSALPAPRAQTPERDKVTFKISLSRINNKLSQPTRLIKVTEEPCTWLPKNKKLQPAASLIMLFDKTNWQNHLIACRVSLSTVYQLCKCERTCNSSMVDKLKVLERRLTNVILTN